MKTKYATIVSKVPIAPAREASAACDRDRARRRAEARVRRAAAAAGNTPSRAIAKYTPRREHQHRAQAAEHADDHDRGDQRAAAAPDERVAHLGDERLPVATCVDRDDDR